MLWRKWWAVVLALALLGVPMAAATEETAAELPEAPEVTYSPVEEAAADPVPESTAKAVLLMDAGSGTVLWEKNAHEVLEPASVTKIMTMLLVCEAVDAGALTPDTMVTASAHAAGMGGSQVYLEEGEQMSVDDLLKAVAVSSGNDAAVALGEAVAGSESAFVERMNRRAAELGMEHTHFVNCTGLPEDGHVTCAMDIALMSRALLEHELVRQYTGIWMDSLRDGAFGLSSTNKLVRYYDGCTGLKTGFTSRAGFCISATAERDDLELIAVVLGAKTSKDRFSTASTLLDWGFANFRAVTIAAEELPETLPVVLGAQEQAALCCPTARVLVRAADTTQVTGELRLSQSLEAPVEAGQCVGWFVVRVGDAAAAVEQVTAAEAVEALTMKDVLCRFVKIMLSGHY